GSMPPFQHLKAPIDHRQKTRPVGRLRWPLFLLWLFPRAGGHLSRRVKGRRYRRPYRDALLKGSEKNHLALFLYYLFVQTLLPFLHQTAAISCYNLDQPTERAPSSPQYLFSLDFRS